MTVPPSRSPLRNRRLAIAAITAAAFAGGLLAARATRRAGPAALVDAPLPPAPSASPPPAPPPALSWRRTGLALFAGVTLATSIGLVGATHDRPPAAAPVVGPQTRDLTSEEIERRNELIEYRNEWLERMSALDTENFRAFDHSPETRWDGSTNRFRGENGEQLSVTLLRTDDPVPYRDPYLPEALEIFPSAGNRALALVLRIENTGDVPLRNDIEKHVRLLGGDLDSTGYEPDRAMTAARARDQPKTLKAGRSTTRTVVFQVGALTRVWDFRIDLPPVS
ncbi:hypothetical protein [Actinoplanes sp. CA-252034]|uniref:hypothetical protein n=1 Tax=Actinoplanes sp. CA-252034 TaxID=3239906 RepID=UPI003D95EE0E